MTLDIVLVLLILIISVVFLATEWIPMEATALLNLGVLATTQLLTPSEALSGFSNPAVITIWAVFILSGGLTRTGVANVIGRYVLRLGRSNEVLLITTIMVSSGIMSAFMNNVAVAALMLPVVMDISRRTQRPPSRLLMPLAYGCLLGGLTTLIGTPPNILVSDALRDNGLQAFGLFDYTPVGLAVMGSGLAFMLLVGRHLLPKQNPGEVVAKSRRFDFKKAYDLKRHMFLAHLPKGSALVGKSLAQTRLRSLLGLNAVAITREDRSILAPSPSERLEAGDILTVEGSLEHGNELAQWCQLAHIAQKAGIAHLFSLGIETVEVQLGPGSSLAGRTLNDTNFRGRFGVNALATRRGTETKRWDFQDEILEPGTILLLQGTKDHLYALRNQPGFENFREVSESALTEIYRLEERLFTAQIPEDSGIVGKTLNESRLGDALGIRVLSIIRNEKTHALPQADDRLYAGDRLVFQGNLESMDVLKGLEGLTFAATSPQTDAAELESEEVGLVEAMLSPQSVLAGRTLRQLRFQDKHGLTVLAIWREGQAILSDLRDLPLRFGDALLLHGRRTRFAALGQEPDFLVLTESAQEVPRESHRKVALLLFAAVILAVALGLTPIYIAAVIGAALMVVTKCLTMEEAYRYIEWKAVFLIAGMLPLGVALDKTGAARYLADGVVAIVGPFGPTAVMGGLVALTFAATCFIPTAALVVLMAPIALKTSADLGMAPHSIMMAIAMASSASFITPVSHPANVLVMGPGGYRFLDYVKVGLPLTLVVYAVLMIAVPHFWPM